MSVLDVIAAPFRAKPNIEEIGIGGFKTLVRVTESYERTFEIPTTFLEDGSFVSDHKITNPKILTITGDVSDVFVSASTFTVIKRELESKLGQVTQYLPRLTQSQIQKASEIANNVSDRIKLLDNALERGENFINPPEVADSDSNQFKFMDYLDTISNLDTGIDILSQTRSFEGMFLESIVVDTDNIAASTEFTMVFIEVRFTKTITSEVVINPAQAAKDAVDGEKDKGTQSPEPEQEDSLLSKYGPIFLNILQGG